MSDSTDSHPHARIDRLLTDLYSSPEMQAIMRQALDDTNGSVDNAVQLIRDRMPTETRAALLDHAIRIDLCAFLLDHIAEDAFEIGDTSRA